MSVLIFGAITVFIAILTFLYQRGILPPKYEMSDIHPMRDPVTVKLFLSNDGIDRLPRCILRHDVPKYKQDGFKIIRIFLGREFPLGGECIWRGKVSDGSIQDCVLMAKPKRIVK